MSSTTNHTAANPTEDGQSVLYSSDTHYQFLEGKNVGFFSGQQTYHEDPITCVGYMGVVTNDRGIYESQALREIVKEFSGKHMVSGRSEWEVDVKWGQKEAAIAEQFAKVSDRIQDLISQGDFGPVSIWRFDDQSAALSLLGEQEPKVYVLTTALRPSNHVSLQDPVGAGTQDTTSIAPFENPPSPTATRQRRGRAPRRGPVGDINAVQIFDGVDEAGWPIE
jgi:hypothetical protein